jgi:hypothetical protein
MLARKGRYHAAQSLNFLFSQKRPRKHIAKTAHHQWALFFGLKKSGIAEFGFDVIVKTLKLVFIGGLRACHFKAGAGMGIQLLRGHAQRSGR